MQVEQMGGVHGAIIRRNSHKKAPQALAVRGFQPNQRSVVGVDRRLAAAVEHSVTEQQGAADDVGG